MMASAEETLINISRRAYEKLTRARREGETYSDVILRLISATLEGLQRRGEIVVTTSDGRRFRVSVDQERCLGAMSCVTVAPQVFAFDTSPQGQWRKRGEPLGMRDVGEGEVDSETLIRAAESCPYRAIRLMDADTGEEVLQ